MMAFNGVQYKDVMGRIIIINVTLATTLKLQNCRHTPAPLMIVQAFAGMVPRHA